MDTTFGEKLKLSQELEEDLTPFGDGFIPSTSGDETSGDHDDSTVSPFSSPEKKPTSKSQDSSTESSSGIGDILKGFKKLALELPKIILKTEDERAALAGDIVNKHIDNPVLSPLLKYYNLNSHLINPSHLFYAIIDIGDSEDCDKVIQWKYRFEGIVMEKNLNKDIELRELRSLCQTTCQDIQKLIINYSSSESQLTTLVSESKQIQIGTYDTLIQLQEKINDMTIPKLPSASLPPSMKKTLDTSWIIHPIKIQWVDNQVRVFAGKSDVPLTADQLKMIQTIKRMTIEQLQKLKNHSLGSLTEIWNQNGKSEDPSILAAVI
ncbi:hypothetical protein [Hymenopteran rhabdo-related virus 23]|uniref:Uncharacterized protein n=1 Tax=Hymenopteran rhabdo-related virus 23 TaxID=2847804 RepID=A0AAE9GXF9_9RHAB|nr:hypothetical protein QKT06_gp2 [Hymenopteran rhabdo-related virus]UOS86042.1 hypothetical protein [Hymenopteran rhabdo-related virus 23]